MTSFVVSSVNKDKRNDYIAGLSKTLHIDCYDITTIDKEQSKNIGSIGIDEIKLLHQKIFLKPINSDQKIVILDDAHLLTTEAQNALLKVLEEPPERTIIILSSATTDALLPTIISRCQIVELEKEKIDLSPSEILEFNKFLDELNNMRVGDRLKKAEELAKDKENALVWIAKLIMCLRGKMLTDEIDMEIVEDIKILQKLHTLLKTTNVNPRFAIETTLLSL
jgi:DNA polymerase III delta prime subunit